MPGTSPGKEGKGVATPSPSVHTLRLFAPRDISGYPNVLAYLRRIGERPAFRRAMAKADPGFDVPLS